jgi:hypothetical protein
MRSIDVGRSIVSGCIVYVAMAACSGGGSGGPGGFGAGSDAGGIGSSSDGSVLDALSNPVPDAHADPATSGSRLKAMYRVGDDGSREFAGWRDSARNEDCFFQTATDGTTRCMPTTGATVAGYFADAGCTAPVAYLPTSTGGCASPPKYARSSETLACGIYAVKLATLGSAFSGSTVYAKGPTSCIATAPIAGFTYFNVGSDIGPAAFVQATIAIDP